MKAVKSDRPTYVVFAGVNGAGKSTFYHSDFWLEDNVDRKMPRVNPDEILLSFDGDPQSKSDQLRAGKEALKQIDHYFQQLESFNQETTLTGKIALRTIKRARNLGYRIVLYYIGVNSPEISSMRIAHRVEMGGHYISKETVKRRYDRSLSNLSNVIDLCDEVIVLDNTDMFIVVARWTNGVISWVGRIFDKAPWLIKAINDDSIWRNTLI